MREDIRRRIKRAGGSKASVTPEYCYLCGRRFGSISCLHSFGDQEAVVDEYRRDKLLLSQAKRAKPPTELLLSDANGDVWRIRVSTIGTLTAERLE